MTKRFFTLLALGLLALPAFAQQQTLIGGDVRSTGFGGAALKVTCFNDDWGLMVGGSGAWCINSTVALGIAGYGMATNMRGPAVDTSQYLDFGYGGGTIEYIINSDDLIHFSVNALIGAGAVNNRFNHSNLSERSTWNHGDAFFVVEPGANVEVNLAKFMRANIGASYRWVNGIELDGLSNKSVNGPSANLMLKFGAF